MKRMDAPMQSLKNARDAAVERMCSIPAARRHARRVDVHAAQEPDGRDRDALRAARGYYLQHLTMDAIAAEMHVSRPTVSRLLDHARSTGIVTIDVASPFDAPGRIEDGLRDRYGVQTHVVPVPERLGGGERLERVALVAAHLVTGLFASNMSMGLAWGSTVDAVSRHLVRKRTSNTRIVQLNGAGNRQTTGLAYASEILRRFGDAMGAQVTQFPLPAFFDDPATKEAMWRERSTRLLTGLQSRVDVALFGIGSPFAEVPSHVYAGGYLEPGDVEELAAQHVVGDIATVFYREDGSRDGIGLNARSSGLDLDALRRIPRRVCVVVGRSKLDGLRGALAGGYLTDLVIDEATAREL